MSLNQEDKDIKVEEIENGEKEKKAENELTKEIKISKEDEDINPVQPDETLENYNIQTTLADLKINFENEEPKDTLGKIKNNMKVKDIPVDVSTAVLNNDEIPAHETINQLNIPPNKKNEDKTADNTNQNLSFMQRTKSWMSNMWTNVKNYNYGKYNIFKKTEMEDILDAHGNHMKIPKNRKEKELKRIKTDNKEGNGLKYGNINYEGYYASSNINVFSGYPF
jgi:hypothetical protein